MRTEIYQWMKNITLFYVMFQAVLQLIPDKKYEKYVRFYMGLLLILLMLSPVFVILGTGEEMWRDFVELYNQEELQRLQSEAENLENYYLLKEQEWKEEWDSINKKEIQNDEKRPEKE